MLRLFENKKL